MNLREKLLRFANDPAATPAERELYARKAEELKGRPSRIRTHTDDVVERYCREMHITVEEFNRQLAEMYPTTYATGKPVTCCCKGAGLSRKECAVKKGCKTPCPCACHPRTGRTKRTKV